ncbi:MAG: preprotein translocase subunit SecE [Firmicutes bacterium]|jgi:preprotein translocase subunit SecE|nr:preprotein translocase subunit SecE [Bacillota bacterium]
MAETVTKKVAAWGQRVARFFREVRAELGKVIWPNRPQVVSYTGVVIVSVLIVSALIWVVDSAISQLLLLLIK